MCRSKLSNKKSEGYKSITKVMFLIIVDSNGKRVDRRIWELAEATAAMRALVECDRGIHLAVITARSDATESFVSAI